MTDINELQRFSGKGHEVYISYYDASYTDLQWRVELAAEHDGTKLKVEARGVSPEEAFLAAAKKFDRATFSGLPEMNPALTYETRALDDEVPF